jgi:hypothetical protein
VGNYVFDTFGTAFPELDCNDDAMVAAVARTGRSS